MNKRDFIMRALDANAVDTGVLDGLDQLPTIWDRMLRDYEEENLIVTKLAQQYDFRGPGKDYIVTVDAAPSAAEALTEGVGGSVYAISSRQVTFLPIEYGARFELTRNAAVRAFYNVADNIVKKLGYSLALKKDALGYAAVLAGAGNEVIANDVADTDSLTSTDVINLSAITKGIRLNEEDLYTNNKYLLISYKQKQDLLDITQIQKANEFGTRDAIAKGYVGNLFGLEVFATHSVTVDTTGSGADFYGAVIVGQSQTGETAYGYAVKRDPMIEKDYSPVTRHWDIVAHEEYDFKVLHPNALCTVYSA